MISPRICGTTELMTGFGRGVRAALVCVVVLAACARESDGRGVVMVPPDEGGGAESSPTLRRPASRTIGGSREAQQVMGWQSEAAQLHEEAVARFDALASALAADRCPSAEELRDRICDLAARICEIAELHPADGPTTERCADANARCVRASESVTERCEY